MSTIETFGSVDERSLEQLERCMEAGDAAHSASRWPVATSTTRTRTEGRACAALSLQPWRNS